MIKEFHIAAAHTINKGNYNSMRVEAGITVSLSENDQALIVEIKENAQKELRKLLEETYVAQNKQTKGEAK
jgi:hypothetical protein